MESLLPKAKAVLPPVGLHDNFHYQQLSRQANTDLTSGETYIAAYIPSDMHDQIFERAVISFEKHYYKSEIEDSQFEKFSRSIRSINAGMEEIRQYYKSQRQKFEYSFCIITTSGNEFLLAACGQTYIIAEDEENRLHLAYAPEDFVDFSEVISGTTTDIRNIFLAVCSETTAKMEHDLGSLAYSVLLASEGRTELPWLAATIDFYSKDQQNAKDNISNASRNRFSGLRTSIALQLAGLKKRMNVKKKSSQSSTHRTPTEKNKSESKVSLAAKSFWNNIWSKYINPNPTRVLIIIGLVIILIIGGSIGYNIYNTNQNISTQFQNIQSLYTSAQSANSNANKGVAEDKLNQVIETINQLKPTEKAAIIKYAQSHKQPSLDEIATNSQILLDTIHNINRVDGQKVFSEADYSYTEIALINNTAYLLNPQSGKIASYNITSKKGINKTNASLTGMIWLTSSSETNQIFAGSPQSIFQIKPDLVAIEQKTSSSTWPIADAFSSYSGSLYFLMPSQGQIYRFRPTGTNQFGPQTNYLKSADSSLTTASAMSVANTIYVSSKTGQISLFSQGSSQIFTTTGLPKLDNVAQLAYRATPESLILFDVSANSFTFLSIQGNSAIFTKEYIVKNTTNITSFTIDEKNNLIYYTCSEGLFSIPLP